MIIEVNNLSSPELSIYTLQNETQLKHYYEPDPGIFIAESPNVIERAIKGGYTPLSFLVSKEDFTGQSEKITENCSAPVYMAETSVLKSITGFPMTRGMLCAFRRNVVSSYIEVCEKAKRVAILENVVNPTNIGAIFRSAAALNMDAVLLTPGCCDPLYRRSARVSMGTVFQIPWAYIVDKDISWEEGGNELMHRLGFKTASMALWDNSISIDNPVLKEIPKLAIILGTEGEGLKEQTIIKSDYTVKIPMTHGVDSLNVAAASAVAFWELANRI